MSDDGFDNAKICGVPNNPHTTVTCFNRCADGYQTCGLHDGKTYGDFRAPTAAPRDVDAGVTATSPIRTVEEIEKWAEEAMAYGEANPHPVFGAIGSADSEYHRQRGYGYFVDLATVLDALRSERDGRADDARAIVALADEIRGSGSGWMQAYVQNNRMVAAAIRNAKARVKK